jgi:hypothetical protein
MCSANLHFPLLSVLCRASTPPTATPYSQLRSPLSSLPLPSSRTNQSVQKNYKGVAAARAGPGQRHAPSQRRSLIGRARWWWSGGCSVHSPIARVVDACLGALVRFRACPPLRDRLGIVRLRYVTWRLRGSSLARAAGACHRRVSVCTFRWLGLADGADASFNATGLMRLRPCTLEEGRLSLL